MTRGTDDRNMYMCVCLCMRTGISTEVDQLPRIHKGPDPNFYKTALTETGAPQMTRFQCGGKGKSAEQSVSAVRKFSENAGRKEGDLNLTVVTMPHYSPLAPTEAACPY